MAETLEDFDWRPYQRNSKYPWDQWLDGQIWKLVKGEDFDCEPEAIRMQAKKRAKVRGVLLRSRIREDDEVIVLQAHPKPDPQGSPDGIQ